MKHIEKIGYKRQDYEQDISISFSKFLKVCNIIANDIETFVDLYYISCSSTQYDSNIILRFDFIRGKFDDGTKSKLVYIEDELGRYFIKIAFS